MFVDPFLLIPVMSTLEKLEPSQYKTAREWSVSLGLLCWVVAVTSQSKVTDRSVHTLSHQHQNTEYEGNIDCIISNLLKTDVVMQGDLFPTHGFVAFYCDDS